MPIERATEGAVTRRDLRPNDYQIHWPELTEVQASQALTAMETVADTPIGGLVTTALAT